MATDDYAKIEHDMAAMLRESFPVTWPPGLATKLSLGAAPNRVIKPRKQTLILDGKKGRANLSERKLKTRTVHFNGLKNER